MAKCVAIDPKGPTRSGRTCFVPLTAKLGSIIPASDAQAASTDLKCYSGKTKDSFRDWIQLYLVNVLPSWLPCGRTDLCEDRPVFNHIVHNPLRRSVHHWRIFI